MTWRITYAYISDMRYKPILRQPHLGRACIRKHIRNKTRIASKPIL